MPAVVLGDEAKIRKRIKHIIDNGCDDMEITQQTLESKMHMNHSTFWRKKSRDGFAPHELKTIFDILDVSNEDILKIFGR